MPKMSDDYYEVYGIRKDDYKWSYLAVGKKEECIKCVRRLNLADFTLMKMLKVTEEWRFEKRVLPVEDNYVVYI